MHCSALKHFSYRKTNVCKYSKLSQKHVINFKNNLVKQSGQNYLENIQREDSMLLGSHCSLRLQLQQLHQHTKRQILSIKYNLMSTGIYFHHLRLWHI